jgi:hypothetical protein
VGIDLANINMTFWLRDDDSLNTDRDGLLDPTQVNSSIVLAYGAVYLGFILARASCILDLLPLERAGAQFYFAPLTDSRIEAAHNVATQLSCRTSATLSWIRRQPFRSAIPAHLADAVASERICTLSPSTRVTGGLRTTCSPDFTPVSARTHVPKSRVSLILRISALPS